MHEKFTYKDGKQYGPYLYENKRVDGKIVTSYVGRHGQGTHSLGYWVKFWLFVVTFAFILIGVQTWFSSPTGQVAIELDPVFVAGEPLAGTVKFNIKAGELVPQDAKVILRSGNQSAELLLSEVSVQAELLSGSFFAEGVTLSGTGEGYGAYGTRTSYPTLDFQLLITSSEDEGESVSGGEGSVDGEEENVSVSGGEEVIGETTDEVSVDTEGEVEEERGEEEGVGAEEVVESEEGEDAEALEGGEGSVVTGNVLIENAFTIEGQVSSDEPFSYALDAGQEATLVRGSVRYNETELQDDVIDVAVSSDGVVVTTDYTFEEQGFGEEYLGDYEVVLTLDLASFAFVADQPQFTVELAHEDISIATASVDLTVETTVNGSLVGLVVPDVFGNLTVNGTEANTTNVTFGNVSVANVSFLGTIPLQRLSVNGSVSLDVSEYFVGAEHITVEGEHVNATIVGFNVTLEAVGGFKGATRVTITGWNETESAVSNPFTVLVSSGAVQITTARARIKVGEPVKWVTNISLDTPENLTLALPAEAENITITAHTDEGVKEELDATSLLTGEVTVEIELEHEFFVKRWFSALFKGITGNVVEGGVEGDLTLALEEPEATEYLVSYYTDAPIATEQETGTGKEIMISGPDTVEYTDVIAFTTLDNEVSVADTSSISLVWHTTQAEVATDIKEVEEVPAAEVVEVTGTSLPDAEDNEDIAVDLVTGQVTGVEAEDTDVSTFGSLFTGNVVEEGQEETAEVALSPPGSTRSLTQPMPFDAYDLDEDGKVDYLEWVVPHLSNQSFTLTITRVTATTDLYNVTIESSGETSFSHLTNNFANTTSTFPGDKLLAYLPFDRNTPTEGFDFARNYNASFLGDASTLRTGCFFRDCIDFDGTESGANVWLNIDSYENLTVSTWVKASSLTPSAEGVNTVWSNDNGGWDRGLAISCTGNNEQWGIFTGLSCESTGVTVPLNTWVYTTTVYSSTNISFYVNGTHVWSYQAPASGYSGTAHLLLGRSGYGAGYYGGGSCTGTEYACDISTFQSVEACNAQSGCSASMTYDSCSGTAESCSNMPDEASCGYQSGCSADYGNSCHDFDGDEGTCSGTTGCSWEDPDCNGNYYSGCSGDALECSTGNFPYVNACNAQSGCTGSESYGSCDGTATTCDYYGDGASCVAQLGCSWPTTIGSSFLDGSLDELMVLNTALNSSHILALFQNTSARMSVQGEQYLFPYAITPGSNSLNLSLQQYDRQGGTNISLRIGQWNRTVQGYNVSDLNSTANAFVAYFNFDNVSSLGENQTLIVDRLGRLNLTAYNGAFPNASRGLLDGSFQFDGSNDLLNSSTVKVGTSLNGSSPRTISVWIYPTLATTSPLVWWGSGSLSRLFLLGLSAERKIYFAGYSDDLLGSTTFSLNVWTHVAVTYTGSNLTIYLNGKPDGSGTKTFATSDSSLMVGKYDLSGGWTPFKGTMDELMIFNRSLSADEVAELATKGRANWNFTAPQNLSAIVSADNASRNTFTISPSAQQILTQFTLLPDANRFFTPILFANATYFANASFVDMPAAALPSSAITLSSCQNINATASGVYALNQSITSATTCLTINASHVSIDCQGNTITYGLAGSNSAFGIDARNGTSTMQNITIKNCIIQKAMANGSSGTGIIITRGSNISIFNNTIRTNGTTNNFGIQIATAGSQNYIGNNTIATRGTSGLTAISISAITATTVEYNNITIGWLGGTTGSDGIVAGTGANTLVRYNTLLINGTGSIEGINGGTSILNNTLTYIGTGTDVHGVLAVSGALIANNTINISGVTSYGFYLNGVSAVTLQGNNITQTGSNALFVEGNTIGEFRHNVTTDNVYQSKPFYYYGGGSMSPACPDNTIVTNPAYAHLSLIGCTNVTLLNWGADNAAHDTIIFAGTNDSTIRNATVVRYGGPGVKITTNSYRDTIAGSNITTYGANTANYGVYVFTNTGNITLANNTIRTNGTTNAFGILISTTSGNNTLFNNTIFTEGSGASAHGIYVFTTVGQSLIDSNTIVTRGSTTSYGLYLDTGVRDFIVTNNSFNTTIGSSHNGISLDAAHGSFFAANRIATGLIGGSTNNEGIVLLNSANNTFLRNTVLTNGTTLTSEGISVSGPNSRNNSFSHNSVSARGSALYVVTSSGLPTGTTFTNNTLTSSLSHFQIGTAAINDTALVNQYAETFNLTGAGSVLALEDTRFGKIQFLNTVNGSGANLSKSIRILNNSIFFNATTVGGGFNKSANLTFYAVPTAAAPYTIIRDGVTCTDCTNLTAFTAGTVVINVTGAPSAYYALSYTGSDTIAPSVSIIAPLNRTYIAADLPLLLNITTDENATAWYTFDAGITNYSLTPALNKRTFNASHASLSSGSYTLLFYANDSTGNVGTAQVILSTETDVPQLTFVTPSPAQGGTASSPITLNATVTHLSNNRTYGFFRDGLVLWYRFDNRSERGENMTSIVDWSDTAYNLTAQGTTLYNTSAQFGGGTSIAGSGNYFLTPAIPLAWGLNMSFTMSAWVYEYTTAGGNQRIFTQAQVGSPNTDFGLTSTGTRFSCSAGNTANPSVTYGPVSANQWYHVVCAYTNRSQAANITLYVNGVARNSTLLSSPVVHYETNYYVGRYPLSSIEFLNGQLDEVLVFNRTLSSDEIKGLYNASQYAVTRSLGTITGSQSYTLEGIDPAGNRNTTTLSFTAQAASTCTYSSGNWAVNASDNCTITSNVNLLKNNFTITGRGTFTLNGANISNYTRGYIAGTSGANDVAVRLINGGKFVSSFVLGLFSLLGSWFVVPVLLHGLSSVGAQTSLYSSKRIVGEIQ